jgi:hypothetical protein
MCVKLSLALRNEYRVIEKSEDNIQTQADVARCPRKRIMMRFRISTFAKYLYLSGQIRKNGMAGHVVRIV